MALFNEIASSDALRMDSMLQPGDIQLLNNHTQLHTRAEFEDFPVSTCLHRCRVCTCCCPQEHAVECGRELPFGPLQLTCGVPVCCNFSNLAPL